MKHFRAFIILLMICAGACKHDNVSVNEAKYVIHISEEACKGIGAISEIVDSVRYVPLGTNQDCFISNVTRIFYRKDRYYILDSQAGRVLVFSSDGRFLF